MKVHKTSSKADIFDGARKEIEFLVSRVEEFNIPETLIININQTPLKYVSVSKETMEKKNKSPSVTIEGSDDKKMITGTFAVTLRGNFLPMQLICSGKINQCIPRYSDFSEIFRVSANPKNFSNTEEPLKYLYEAIIPYVVKERSESKLLNDQKALMIMDIFTGQMTPQGIQHYA